MLSHVPPYDRRWRGFPQTQRKQWLGKTARELLRDDGEES